MAKSTTVSKLARIEADLEDLASVLEKAGFTKHAEALDVAADHVGDVKEDFVAVL